MGLGMARAGTVSSSLPGEGDDQDEEFLPPEEGDELDDEGAILDAAAVEEGYESHADKLSTEEAAGRQGWRPLSDYRGKPGGWKSAKQFVTDGQSYLPFVQKELRETKLVNERMSQELDGLRTEVSNTRADMQKLLDFSRKASQAGYDKAIKDLEAQRRDAVAQGDVTTYDQIGEQIEEMGQAREDAIAEPEPPKPVVRRQPAEPKGVDPAVVAFVEDNPWFNTDRVLNAAMIEEHKAVIKESPAMSLADQLDAAKERVMEQFPKKFGITPANQEQPPVRRQPQAPLAPRGGGAIPPRGKTGIEAIADPAERAQARIGFKRALNAMPGLTEAEYLVVFNDPHADVLDVLKSSKK